MKYTEAVLLALRQLRVQKLKSFFTLLGVMIGVMFLIAVVSIVAGMSRYMEEDFVGKLMGVNTFELRRFPNINLGNVTEEEWREWQRRPYILQSDVEPVVSQLPEGTRWAIQNAGRNIEMESELARPRKLFLFAVDGDYFEIRRMEIARGRALAPQELAHGALVTVIGDETARHFYPNVDPVGKELKIGSAKYRVVGVAEKQGSIFGMSLDKFAVTPLNSPARRMTTLGHGRINTLMIHSGSKPEMLDAMEDVRQIMRGRHKLRPAQPDNFALTTSESALEFWTKVKRIMTFAGAALPAIGLVVGAMVIMNIMLVAVAERTREIGIRKALGARRRDILGQFLAESATLSTLGAAIGVGLGFALAGIIAATTALPASVAPWSILVGILLGTVVGIVAGVYPASRASRLDPVHAMRQET
ncbi:MAG TPA: ABC transporter permease [Gemmatimonadaceae bacterium]|nr:ABC transporter permease [Gemmatimonadaceae bacterium]